MLVRYGKFSGGIVFEPSGEVKTIRPESLTKAIYVVMISFAVAFGLHVFFGLKTLLDYYFM